MTGHRAAPPVTTEVSDQSDDDLLTAGRPESMRHASNFLSAPPLAGSPAGYTIASAESGQAGYGGQAGYSAASRRDGGVAGYPPPPFGRDGYPPSLADDQYAYPPSPLADAPARAPDQPAATCTLDARPESVKTGRDFTRSTLLGWGMAAPADVAELVVSELVTNALRHGVSATGGLRGEHTVRLRLLAQAPFVMCMVADSGSEIPVLRDSDPAAESGRGLQVVEACSVRWGWHLLDGGGKVVWALLR